MDALLKPLEIITGSLSRIGEINGNITLVQTIEGELTGGGEILPSYDGEYEVTPGMEDISLDTNGKKLVNDIVIKEIPYSEVSNPSGGLTVNIGGI